MIIVRDVMYCKPGKVRAMVDKFKALSNLSGVVGFRSIRVMTDICAERFWTVAVESEAASLEEYEKVEKEMMSNPEFRKVMEGYHDLVEHGRREIYKLES